MIINSMYIWCNAEKVNYYYLYLYSLPETTLHHQVTPDLEYAKITQITLQNPNKNGKSPHRTLTKMTHKESHKTLTTTLIFFLITILYPGMWTSTCLVMATGSLPASTSSSTWFCTRTRKYLIPWPSGIETLYYFTSYLCYTYWGT